MNFNFFKASAPQPSALLPATPLTYLRGIAGLLLWGGAIGYAAWRAAGQLGATSPLDFVSTIASLPKLDRLLLLGLLYGGYLLASPQYLLGGGSAQAGLAEKIFKTVRLLLMMGVIILATVLIGGHLHRFFSSATHAPLPVAGGGCFTP